MMDINTVSAGGGTIARVDRFGSLEVGPQSAGAVPGPVCYGRGGEQPTITDCNLLLGLLSPDNFLGGVVRVTLGEAPTSADVTSHGALGGVPVIESRCGSVVPQGEW